MIEPYTPEWWQARLGKVTASRIADVVARTKRGWGASRDNYAVELMAERLTGKTAPSYSSAAMEWGTATEPAALAAYRFFTDRDAVPCGWMQHARITQSGATPDGAVHADDQGYIYGLVEIKCPKTTTHIDTLQYGKVPGEYVKQCQWQMACVPTADWVDFVSYDPRMPEDLQLFVKRVRRDRELIASLEIEVDVFLGEIDQAMMGLWEPTGCGPDGPVSIKDALKRSLEAVE